MIRFSRHSHIVQSAAFVCVALLIQADAATPAHTDGNVEIIMHSPLNSTGPDSQCLTHLCVSLKERIRAAKSSVDFAIYGFRGQPEILEELVRAQQRGVRIRGVVDQNSDGENYYKDTHLLYEKLHNIRNDRDTDQPEQGHIKQSALRDKCQRPPGHRGPLQCFEGRGYASKEPIRSRGAIMHHKFFVFDAHTVWTGSANISDTGIGGYNANVVAVIQSPSIARYYTDEFERMYVHHRFHEDKAQASHHAPLPAVRINDALVELSFSPQDNTMNSKLIKLIEDARERVDVAMFYLTHNDMSRALAAAARRGITVRVILDATGASNGYSKHDYLRDNGVLLKVESWGGKMHAKAALIDGDRLVVGSMNWTKSGNAWNDENTLIIRSPRHARQFQTFYDSLWASVPDRWLRKDTKPESPDSGSSCRDGIDNDWDSYIDQKDWDC